MNTELFNALQHIFPLILLLPSLMVPLLPKFLAFPLWLCIIGKTSTNAETTPKYEI